MTERTLNQYRPTLVTPPGVTISDLLEEQGIRQNELATRMGVTPKFINELVAGKAPVTPPTALALERALGTPAHFWLAREAQYQEARARESEAACLHDSIPWLAEIPYLDMVKFGWVRACSSKVEAVSECLNFFGVASTAAWREQYVDRTAATAYRMSTKVAASEGSVAAWLRAGEREGLKIECAPYDRDLFLETVIWARSLTTVTEPSEFLPQLLRRFAACGVAVAIVRAPRKCPISGAVHWLTPAKALIQLSFKYLRNDNFWFTFFHECGHIALHSKKLLFLEGERVDDGDEGEANTFAADKLIAPSDWSTFSPFLISDAAIREFANKVGIAPGIVLGRLQNEKRVPWSRLNQLEVTYKWVD
jgi:HTH-type transcriptional regulator / antitoxin HigA